MRSRRATLKVSQESAAAAWQLAGISLFASPSSDHDGSIRDDGKPLGGTIVVESSEEHGTFISAARLPTRDQTGLRS
jgi:hypothetical protein